MVGIAGGAVAGMKPRRDPDDQHRFGENLLPTSG